MELKTRYRVVAAMAALVFCVDAQAVAVSAPPPIAHDPGVAPHSSPPIKTHADTICPAADIVAQVVILTNAERLANGGLPPLKRVAELEAAAGGHSQAMAQRDFFAHCDLDTQKSPWVRMTDAGYSWSGAAENIAAGYTGPVSVMAGWMGSSGHRANILDGSLREIGVGYFLQTPDAANIRTDANRDCAADGTLSFAAYRYWTQNFGRRNTVYPLVIEREAAVALSRDVNLYVYGSGWATEMRLRNDSGTWSAWQPFAAEIFWPLPAENGDHSVSVQLRNSGGTIREAQDTICLEAPVDPTDKLLLRDSFEP